MVKIDIKSNYELINELKRQNLFTKMIRNGLVSSSFESYHNIYERYLQLSTSNAKKRDIICDISIEFNVSERSIYIIINKMK